MADTDLQHQLTNQITGQKRWWALGAVMLTMFFSSLDQTIIATAMPTVIGDLKGFSIYAWVFTAYIMATAVTVPIYGRLSDIYGRKPFYVFGLVMFMIGSAVSGQAHTMMQLIVARAVQGIGGGAMLSMPQATIGDIFNPKERGRWMGLILSIFGLASIVGPFAGGWITDNWGWRWIFYINLPFGALAAAAVWFALPRVRTEHDIRIDWSGSLLLVAGLIPILLAFTWAGNNYPWGSRQILGLFAAGVAVLVLFVINENHVEDPIINSHLFSNPIFSVALLIALFVSMVFFGAIMFLPLFVQSVVGLSPQSSGVVLTPMMLTFILGAVIGGQLISRTGKYKLQAIIGTAVMTAGTLLLRTMDTATTWPTVVIDMLVLGIGVGSVMPLLNVAVQNAFPYKIMGVVNSTQQFVRSLGGVIAAPVLGTIMANGFKYKLAHTIPAQLKNVMASMPTSQTVHLNPQSLINPNAQQAVKSMFSPFGKQGLALYAQFIGAVKTSITYGFHHLFVLSIFFAATAFIVSFFLKEIPLKKEDYYEDKPTETEQR
jgi:EmrB/QacA subfamily drug resistance transporter